MIKQFLSLSCNVKGPFLPFQGNVRFARVGIVDFLTPWQLLRLAIFGFYPLPPFLWPGLEKNP